ncbi:hypothetical protein [Neobacillus sp. Marseille-QA0830]
MERDLFKYVDIRYEDYYSFLDEQNQGYDIYDDQDMDQDGSHG